MSDHFFNYRQGFYSANLSSRRTFLKQSAAVGMSITSGFSIPAKALAQTPLSQNKITPNPIGFNGERQDPITMQYHLGNGVRMYNPSLMRFHANDSMSPFGKGGINSYAYCLGDPVNRRDPSGHFALLSLLIGMIIGAIIGAIIAAAAEGVKASITGSDFDWKQVAIGAALGAIGGGFGAAAQGASFGVKLGLAIADAVVSGVADFSLNVATGAPLENSAQNAAIGSLIGLVTFGIGSGASALRKNPKFQVLGGKHTFGAKINPLPGRKEGIVTFFDSYKGEKRLNILGHGGIGVGNPFIAGSYYGDNFGGMLLQAGYTQEKMKFTSIRLLACRLGEETPISPAFGQLLSNRMKTPVKAYLGPVTVAARVGMDPADTSDIVGLLSGFTVKVGKEQPRFNYRPIYFKPE